MVLIRKYVLCKCGHSSQFDFSTDLQVEDISVFGRCPACNASLHVSISALLSAQQPQPQPQEGKKEEHSMLDQLDEETKENVEQAVRDLFKS